MPELTSKECPGCGAGPETYEVSQAGYDAYMADELAQFALSDLSVAQRERLITRVCTPCWDKLFEDNPIPDDPAEEVHSNTMPDPTPTTPDPTPKLEELMERFSIPGRGYLDPMLEQDLPDSLEALNAHEDEDVEAAITMLMCRLCELGYFIYLGEDAFQQAVSMN